MTGISAGAALSDAGITDFKIIEYQNRIGGRTLSTDFGIRSDNSTWKVELGTNWVRNFRPRIQSRRWKLLVRC